MSPYIAAPWIRHGYYCISIGFKNRRTHKISQSTVPVAVRTYQPCELSTVPFIMSWLFQQFNGNFRILKWRYVSTIFLAIFCVDISLHSPYIGLIYGRYLQFRILEFPLNNPVSNHMMNGIASLEIPRSIWLLKTIETHVWNTVHALVFHVSIKAQRKNV